MTEAIRKPFLQLQNIRHSDAAHVEAHRLAQCSDVPHDVTELLDERVRVQLGPVTDVLLEHLDDLTSFASKP